MLIGAAAWILAGRALLPVRRLSAAASRITAAELEARLEMRGEPREFKQLIEVYNGMLDRLEASFKQARRFSADAAHELNTPLTILQGHLDALLQQEQKTERQADLTIALEETQHLREIIRKLHLLSQADAGNLPMESQAVELPALVKEVLEDARAMAPGMTFESQLDDKTLIQGDPNLLRQLVFNLLSNAIKYNRPDGRVQIQLFTRDRMVCLEISNTGAAIRPEDAGRLFERFYRGHPARDARVPGRGLGLALALEFAHAHGGNLRLSENQDDRITFCLELPKPVMA
jgi:signal transduction histidine kinase